MNTQNTPSPEDTLLEPVAAGMTQNWRDYISKIDPDPQYIRAFNIPMSDIQNLADFASYDNLNCPSVRAYIAMGTPGDITTLKLVLVPVDASNNDVLSIQVKGDGDTMEEQSAIYDFTSPCPQTCDVNSPLFGS